MPVGSRGSTRASSKGTRGGNKQKSPSQRGGRGGRRGKPITPEIEIPLPPEPPKKEETWLDRLPPVIKPDEEEHIMLTARRKQARMDKVKKICRTELNAILDFSLMFPSDQDKRQMSYVSKRTDLLHGKLTKEIEEEADDAESAQIKKVLLEPLFTVDTRRYLSLSSESIYTDLSKLYSLDLNENDIDDPNLVFSGILKEMKETSKPFSLPFSKDAKSACPFIISVVGPPGGGQTTICQLIRQVLDVEIIEVRFVQSSDPNSKKKKPEPLLPSFFLNGSKQVSVSDDKTAVQQICQIISESPYSGYLIAGFPNTKAQLSSLEKSLSPIFCKSPRGKSSNQASISGFIFALNTPQSLHQRETDPVTGNVYDPGFYVPGFLDLIGSAPSEFPNEISKIKQRLIENGRMDYLQTSPKTISSYAAFENSIKKLYQTLSVPPLSSATELLPLLDEFIARVYNVNSGKLYEANNEAVYNVKLCKLADIHCPRHLLPAADAYLRLHVWRQCLQKFGSDLADQTRLLSTLTNKVEVLKRDAVERFQLWTSQKDEREHMEQFEEVWESSIKLRDANIDRIEVVVSKSGLNELLEELRWSTRTVFSLLITKMRYIRWFNALKVDCESFLTDFELPEVEIPDLKVTFDESIQACLEILGLERQENVLEVENTFDFIEKTSDDDLTIAEAKSSKLIMSKFMEEAKRKEKLLTESLDSLRIDLEKFCRSKCAKEMEIFSRHIKEHKTPLKFCYNTDLVSARIKPLVELLLTVSPPLYLQDFVSEETVLQIEQWFSSNSISFSTLDGCMSELRQFITSNEDLLKAEIALRVICCSEFVDVFKFLSLFRDSQ